MKLNLDFYHEAQSSGISQEEIKVIELDKNTNNFDESLLSSGVCAISSSGK